MQSRLNSRRETLRGTAYVDSQGDEVESRFPGEDMTLVIIAAVVGLIVGAAFGVMQGRAALAGKQAELDARTAELAARTESLSRAMVEIAQRQNENTTAQAEISRLTERAARVSELEKSIAEIGAQLALKQQEASRLAAELDGERKQSAEKLALLQSAKEELSNQFKALASDILEEKSKTFTELNHMNMGQLLNPLKEKLGEFQKKVEDSHLAETNGRAMLSEQLRQLRELNQQMSADASNLTKALTNSGKVQGDWGELMLTRILESSGLRRDKDYFVQQNFKDSEGRNVRPDVLIRLPENRSLIIDSKTSLTAYNEHVNASDEVLKAAALKRHVDSVRKHCKDLSKQSYEDLRDLKSPDFVIMFLPLEPAFMLAISQDDNVWEEAYRGGVLLVSPTTLLFVLRTVAQLWKSEDQKEYVQDIAERGAELYDKLRLFAESMIDVGKSLDSAKGSYEEALKRLSTGSGNAIRQAEMLIELGVKAKKQIPSLLVEKSRELLPGEQSDAAKA